MTAEIRAQVPGEGRPDGAAEVPDARTLRTVFGELVDALGDEMKIEIANNSHVQQHVRRAVEALGGPWAGYLEEWWLHE
jgi:hypothetical protein